MSEFIGRFLRVLGLCVSRGESGMVTDCGELERGLRMNLAKLAEEREFNEMSHFRVGLVPDVGDGVAFRSMSVTKCK